MSQFLRETEAQILFLAGLKTTLEEINIDDQDTKEGGIMKKKINKNNQGSFSSVNAQAFRDDLIKNEKVWIIKDENGIPAPKNNEGKRALPFWSTERRAQNMVESVIEYKDCWTHALTLDEFESKWLKGMEEDDLLVGINWSGSRTTGYDVTPQEVRTWLQILKGK
jgi:hypothetical protein